MISKYTINYGEASNDLIAIQLVFKPSKDKKTTLQMPAWRPGRYELGNFAQYVLPLSAQNEKGEPLAIKKISKDRWEIENNGDEITINYHYSCQIKNAGGTFKSENQLVITPVNCLVYSEHLINESCEIDLNLPQNFSVYSSIKNKICQNYYQLAASPIVAGSRIQETVYTIGKTNFHVVFEGNLDFSPYLEKIKNDFKNFTQKQIDLFGDFPSADYYFLNLIFDEKHYHGVEHLDSTLIALGPVNEFDTSDFYLNLLGISSHELFHYWNICRIRPKELLPYNYRQEQYFDTGYVAEGVITAI
jgi:predicted metalloprotease with PDZ domain